MPCERKHIEAIRAKIRDLRVEDGLIGIDDRITVLLDAALSACDESPWRSTESAPKDGTDVLVAYCDGVTVANCMFSPTYGDMWMSDEWEIFPTHWMPLPAAPEVGKP